MYCLINATSQIRETSADTTFFLHKNLHSFFHTLSSMNMGFCHKIESRSTQCCKIVGILVFDLRPLACISWLSLTLWGFHWIVVWGYHVIPNTLYQTTTLKEPRGFKRIAKSSKMFRCKLKVSVPTHFAT